MNTADHAELSQQMARILEELSELRTIVLDQKTIREAYTTAEAAEALGKAEFTVREWCRLGRMHANKRGSGRGKHLGWSIPHEELLRFRREGLLPARP